MRPRRGVRRLSQDPDRFCGACREDATGDDLPPEDFRWYRTALAKRLRIQALGAVVPLDLSLFDSPCMLSDECFVTAQVMDGTARL